MLLLIKDTKDDYNSNKNLPMQRFQYVYAKKANLIDNLSFIPK